MLFSFLTIACSSSNDSKKIKSVQESIEPAEIKTKINNGESIVIIDVRSEKEYNGNIWHIQGSQLIPINLIANNLDKLKAMNEEIYVVCLSGKRSAVAANILRNNGINALNIKGGMLAWNKIP